MFNSAQKITELGRRFADAGRQARVDVLAAAGPVCGEVAAATAAAAGELVRCAVAGAIAAVMQGPRCPSRQTGVSNDPWDVLDDQAHDAEEQHEPEPKANSSDTQEAESANENNGSRWMTATRMAGTALTVAAGAAASVPGGRLVAAGLGAVAAIAMLAARAGEDTSN